MNESRECSHHRLSRPQENPWQGLLSPGKMSRPAPAGVIGKCVLAPPSRPDRPSSTQRQQEARMQKVTASPGYDEHPAHPPENATIETTQGLSDFWSEPQEEVLHRLRSTPQGISGEEARRRLAGGPRHSVRPGGGRGLSYS